MSIQEETQVDEGAVIALTDTAVTKVRELIAAESEENLALRWYPRGRSKVIVVDPRVTFGAPIIRGTGVPTAVVRERYQAGETLEDIQEDFGIPRLQLEQALEFEEVRLYTAA